MPTTLQFRPLPLVLALQAAFLPAAYAFDITTNTTVTTTETAAATNTVSSGATLTSATVVTVTVPTGTTAITNSGTISQTGTARTIDANTTTPVFTLNNNVGGLITAAGAEVMRLNRPAGSYVINNQGTIWQQGISENGSRAIKADAAFTSTNNQIINGSISNTGAVIRSNGNDAIRLGNNFTLTNYGSIFSNGVVNTSSARDPGQYLNSVAPPDYSAADGVAIEDGRTNVAILNYGSITGPRHGVDGGEPGGAADSNLTNLATSPISGASNSSLITINRLSVTATSPNGVTFDEIINGVTTATQKVTNPVVINYAGGTITGNNGSGVGIDGAGVVINYGTISGNYAGAGKVYRHAINPITALTVNFNGEVLSTDTTSNGDGDGVDMDGVAYVENWGTIRGTGAGGYDSGGRPNGADGIAAGGGTIINRAGATIYGESKGILIDDGASGTLTGSATSTARNIPADGITGATARIYNEGTITGDKRTAVGLVGDYADLLVNYSTGVITGGTNSVLVDALTSTTAAAAVQMGGGNDILINYGKIEGKNGLAIDMGAGDDTLKLFNGGSTGVINGTVVGGAGTDTLETGGTQYFMTGTVTGFESFVVRDGRTTFDYGLGSVNSMQIDSGATAQVNGAMSTTGNLTVDGTFKAPTLTLRTMTVGGNYAQGAAGVLEVGLGANNQSDRINATGTGVLTNGATIAPVARSYVANGATYTLLTATGGLTATPANLLVNNTSANVSYALTKVGNDLVLTATRAATLSAASPAGLGGLGTALDAIGQNGAASSALAAIDNLPTRQAVREAMKQIAPESNGASVQAGQQGSSSVFSALSSRIGTARTDLAMAGGLSAGEKASSRAWVQGVGASAETGSRSGEDSFRSNASGIAGGIEVDRSARGVMGLSVGYTKGASVGTGSGTGDNVWVDTTHFGGYMSQNDGGMTLDVAVLLGYNSYRKERAVVFTGFSEQLRADYAGWQAGGQIEAGFPFSIAPQWSGRWLAGARAGYSVTNAYIEQGSAAVAQQLDRSIYRSLQSVAGVEFNHDLGNKSFLQYRTRYLHEFMDAPSPTSTMVAGGASFSTPVGEPNRDALQLGVGYRYLTQDGVTMTLGYDAEFKDKYLSHQLNARFVWAF